MPWTPDRYPPAMARLPAKVRWKAIQIANALLDEDYDEGRAIRTAIAAAKRWSRATQSKTMRYSRFVTDVPARLAFVLAASAFACAAYAQPKEPRAVATMREHRCYVCHADEDPGAGPSFADIAAHYRGNPDAVTVIGRFVRRGAHGAGPWHMPPHPEISAAQARAMARYIVSLDKRSKPDQPAAATAPRS